MPESPRDKLVQYFSDRFGVAESFWEPYQVFTRSDSLWVASKAIKERGSIAGLRTLRKQRVGLKPTTYILQLLDDEITKNIVDLSREQLQNLVFDRETLHTDLSRGYVALVFQDHVIGCGLVRRDGLITQVPKGRAAELETALEHEDSPSTS